MGLDWNKSGEGSSLVKRVFAERLKHVDFAKEVLNVQTFRKELAEHWQRAAEEEAELRAMFDSMLDGLEIGQAEFGGPEQEETRKEWRWLVFAQSALVVRAHESDSHKLQLNHFALISEDEINEIFGDELIDLPDEDQTEEEEDLKLGETWTSQSAPKEWNWERFGALGAVRNQQSCGACWAFAAVGAIESKMVIESNYLFELSEQELLSCFQPNKYGCIGGNFDTVFRTFKEPLTTNRAFPYQASPSVQCPLDKMPQLGVVTVSGAETRVYADNDKIRSMVLRQPVAVAIEASSRCFQFYRSGILDDSVCASTGKVNHAVLLVGYENYGEKDAAWIVKNSWSSHWGEKGYARIRIKPNSKTGAFSINRLASIPMRTSFASACLSDAAGMETCLLQGKFVNTSQVHPTTDSFHRLDWHVLSQVGIIFASVMGFLFVSRWFVPKKSNTEQEGMQHLEEPLLDS